MRLVLHVGHGKTGTSSVQATLRANADLLAANGICYPAPEKRDGHSALLAMLKPYEKRPRIYHLVPEEKWVKYGHRMRREILNTECDVMVLSSEYLYTQSLEFHTALKKLLNRRFSDVSVHAWIRDPVSFFRSFKAQAMQPVGGEEMRFDPPLERASLRHRQRVETLRSVWGDENVKLHPYNRELMVGGNTTLDFLDKALLEAASLDLQLVERNIRLTEPLTVTEVDAIHKICSSDYKFFEEEGLKL
jgi:hypothetical protein